MSNSGRTYKRFGQRAVLIEWHNHIDASTLDDILLLREKISKYQKIQDLIIGYASLTIIYKKDIEDLRVEIEYLNSIDIKKSPKIESQHQTWTIPVCYDTKFGIDLEKISVQLKLPKTEIIKRHTAPVYTVCFIGFLPGFMYLSGLNRTLSVPRKDSPRLKVEKGSVGIGGEQTGIYPSDSAGGWNIIGKTPISLFEIDNNPPCFVRPGDKLRFEQVSYQKYKAIKHNRSLRNSYFPND